VPFPIAAPETSKIGKQKRVQGNQLQTPSPKINSGKQFQKDIPINKSGSMTRTAIPGGTEEGIAKAAAG
jgi:hypothetical protein